MRILHLLQSNRFFGAENLVCQIINMMKSEKDFEMFYCSIDGEIRKSLQERNVLFFPISELSVSEVKRVIREVKPDIIHSHDMRASFVAALSCGKTTLISHIHNNAFNSRGISLKSIAYLYAAKKSKHIFWVSQSSFEGYAFHSFFSEKSTVLYNMIDANVLREQMKRDVNNYDYDIVYVGRLTYPKNPERLIRVLKKIEETNADVKVAIIGIGELKDSFESLIRDMGLEKNIDVLGYVFNPLKIMFDAKVMVMTSRWEGTPMCALEAMALGLPIVSTPVDGMNELVEDGITGFLSDDDDVLSEKIGILLNNKDVRNLLSDNQIKKSRIFNDVDNYKKCIENVYRSCI